MTSDAPLHLSPLDTHHRQLGAKMVPFAGYSMPLHYGSIIEEHHAVRTHAGVFDVSHMGQLELRGEGAQRIANEFITNDLLSLQPGRAVYSPSCKDNGGILDDLIVYVRSPNDILIICNASNRVKMANWIEEHVVGRIEFRDASDDYGLLAIQGPNARDIVAIIASDVDVKVIKRFAFAQTKLAGVDCMIARTGYTGEDGFEILCAAGQTPKLWDALFAAGKDKGLIPVGLGARDTLRTEAALPLYGHELSESINPYEANLAWTVKLNSAPFFGADALKAVQAAGVQRKLVGLVLQERGIAREGYAIFSGNTRVGEVTSGCPSPTIGKSIALGYVRVDLATVGMRVTIDVRGKAIAAEIVPLPFYKRST